MPGFFDRVKSGAERAAFEADKMRRVSQAQGALKNTQRDLETKVAAWGQQVLALYDAGALTQAELLAAGPEIDALRQKITAQEAEIERIHEEKPPVAEPAAPQAPAPVETEPPAVPVAAVKGRLCANCGSPLAPDTKFCMECGTRVTEE
jgi:hypothetical protein